jgi:hypothetical protein
MEHGNRSVFNYGEKQHLGKDKRTQRSTFKLAASKETSPDSDNGA